MPTNTLNTQTAKLDDLYANMDITGSSMLTYIIFGVVFFIVLMLNDLSISIIVFTYFLLTLCIQLGINLWASIKLCGVVNPGTAIPNTIIPWFLILGVTSYILWNMPGWVRVFSNTIGLAIVKSMFYKLFEVDSANLNVATSNPGEIFTKELITSIYSDPFKLVNEIGYDPTFENWKKNIFDMYFSEKPFFKERFSGYDTASAEGKKTHPLYQLYICVSRKEKIGYFIWLFLIGAITVLVSLTQMYNSQC